MKKVVFALELVVVVGAVLLAPALAMNGKTPPHNNLVVKQSTTAQKPPKAQQTAKAQTTTSVKSNPSPKSTPVKSNSSPESTAQAKPSTSTSKQVQPQETLTASIVNPGPIVANTLLYNIYGASISYGQEGSKPQAGNMYLIISLSITNNGGDTASISPVMMFRLLDRAGVSYNPIVASQAEQRLDGALGPDRTASGQLRFEIPQSLREARLEIDPSIVGAHTVDVNLAIK